MGDFRPDLTADTEDIVMNKLLLEELFQALEELDYDSRRICEFIKQGKTEREIAAEFNVRQSTLNYRKKEIMSELRERLKYFI
jgi:DNA-directed RNA polymerase specialized sigma subunit